jgi:dipeptidyl aminopeptidase/acylaminoacyl peptidase
MEDVGPVYRSRSACYNVDKIRAPLLLLQGDQDTVVPESQTKEMQQTMKEQGKDVEVVIYKGEGHG